MYRYEWSPIRVVIGCKNCVLTGSDEAAIILFFWPERRFIPFVDPEEFITFESGQENVRAMVEIGCFLELQFLVLEQVPKDLTDASAYAD